MESWMEMLNKLWSVILAKVLGKFLVYRKRKTLIMLPVLLAFLSPCLVEHLKMSHVLLPQSPQVFLPPCFLASGGRAPWEHQTLSEFSLGPCSRHHLHLLLNCQLLYHPFLAGDLFFHSQVRKFLIHNSVWAKGFSVKQNQYMASS